MFIHFLNSLKTPDNASLIETIQKGFLALTESYDSNGPISGRFIIVPEVGQIQSADKDNVLLPFENILHYDYFVGYILPDYFHLSVENIIKLKEIHRRKNCAYPFRRGVVDVHPHGETDPDRVSAVFIQVDGRKMTKENIKELIDWFNLQDVESKIHFRDYGIVNLEARNEFNKMISEQNAEKPTIDVDPTQFQTLPALSTFESTNNNNKLVGYKIVGWDETKNRAFSLFDPNIDVNIEKGSVTQYKNGLYLGNSKEFCIDYYSGGTDFQDLLLTYEFNENDLIKGDLDFKNGEIVVKKAKLINIEKLNI